MVALLAVGNLFCTACPMVLVRDAGRQLFHPALRWPRQLRGKWLGIALLVGVLFSYELFDLWELPSATAWLVVGYFTLALAVDVVFKGATFCKYICPIGQFNFAASAMSPTELHVRETAVCRTCRTADCIRGRYEVDAPQRLEQRGCELALFLPMKVGNLDCTMCLDCVRACPHDNIALTTRVPGAELLETRRRSGIGRLTQRTDIAALAVVFTFAGLVNAFAMTGPAREVERGLATMLGTSREAPALALLFVIALVVAPAILLGFAAAVTQFLPRAEPRTLRATAERYVFALVPFGFGMWLAHYGFHLLTGMFTVVPVAQSAAIDWLGWAALGEPAWRFVGLQPGAVFPVQVGCVLLGAVGSVGLVQATSQRDYPSCSALASVPWLVLVAGLTAAALWILAQPMEMRGVSFLG